MDIYLTRHGETHWNQEARCQGVSDIPLSDRGRAQAALLRGRLQGGRFDCIVASDLSRARETALIVAGAGGSPLEIEPGLGEMHHGELEGLTWRELLKGHGPLLERWL